MGPTRANFQVGHRDRVDAQQTLNVGHPDQKARPRWVQYTVRTLDSVETPSRVSDSDQNRCCLPDFHHPGLHHSRNLGVRPCRSCPPDEYNANIQEDIVRARRRQRWWQAKASWQVKSADFPHRF
jgi:hypothetical protein